ncbi:hypothetical protein BWI17_00825 [Betaproteobacteria bacterium GR16-43]|nr:hypothetical protein BWI17_00825 [Betaproteobacteria bacterium GR16-43]
MPGFNLDSTLPPGALSDGPQLTAAANQAIALARSGESRKGLALALLARNQARVLDLRRGEAEALNAAAVVHAIRGDHISAVAAAIDACELAGRLEGRSILGHSRVTLGSAAFALGMVGEARAALEACLAQAVCCGDRELEVRARSGLGIVLGDLGEFEAATQELARVLFLVERHQQMTCPARALSNLANLHAKRAKKHLAAGDRIAAASDCEDADRLAARALEVADARGNLSVQIDAAGIRGKVRDLLGEPHEALLFLASACRAGIAARSRTPLLWVLCEQGRIHRGLGQLDAARTAYDEALEIAAELRPSPKIAEACQGLEWVERAAGNEAAARRWSEQAHVETEAFEHARAQTRRQLDAFFAAG